MFYTVAKISEKPYEGVASTPPLHTPPPPPTSLLCVRGLKCFRKV